MTILGLRSFTSGLLVAIAGLAIASGARAQAPPPAPSPLAPVASFTMSPEVAQVGELVRFTDTSIDPDGSIVRREWDLDEDGVITDPDGARKVQRSYHQLGTYTIFLRVTDDAGNQTQVTRDLVVGDGDGAPPPSPPPLPIAPAAANRAPAISFAFAPREPAAGQSVSFTSTSSDGDGSIAAQGWDLDGDGRFTDASGATAQWSYPTPGTRTVGLRVTDDRGASSTAFESITIVAPPADPGPVGTTTAAAPAPRATPRPRLLAPFPVVRIRGQIFARSVRVSLLSVRAPSGSTVLVRCTGRGCPYAVASAPVRSATRAVRFRQLERRLRAGTVLRVFVTKRGRVGKYTRLTIRRGVPPARTDRCLRDGSARPVRCPSP